MGDLSLPLTIKDGKFVRHKNLKEAIDESISLVISTPLFSNPIDPKFGFVLSNLRFEQIDEKEGVVLDVGVEDITPLLDTSIYEKKISGNSRNFNTFASELKSAIARVEKRLGELKVAMTYMREERAIHIVVTGIIIETGEDYQFHKRIMVWN